MLIIDIEGPLNDPVTTLGFLLTESFTLNIMRDFDFHCSSGSVVKRRPHWWKIVGSIPDRVIPKTF